jgi:hypothetical protein
MPSNSAPPVPVLLVVVLLALAAGWWAVTRYSGSRQDQAYVPVAQEFLAAALAADSVKLATVSDSPDVVSWGLATGRIRPQLLRALLNGLAETAVRKAAENALVLFTSKGFGNCATSPLAVTFRGPPSTARIVALSADCDPRD